jgi:hypothetical protein
MTVLLPRDIASLACQAAHPTTTHAHSCLVSVITLFPRLPLSPPRPIALPTSRPLNLPTLPRQKLTQPLQRLLRLRSSKMLHRLEQMRRHMLIQIHPRRTPMRNRLRGRLRSRVR